MVRNLEREKVFNRFVEVGRVVFITYGPDAGKYAVIVDIVDQARALIDGPTSGVKRQVMTFRRLHLTNLVVKIPRAIGTQSLKKALEKQNLEEQWKNSPWGKKQEIRQKRANATDFDRFQVMIAKKTRRAIIYGQVNKAKKN